MKALTWLWQQIRTYPVAAQYVVQTTIGVGTAFGLGWSAAQVAATLVCSGAILSFLTHQVVTPNVSLPK